MKRALFLLFASFVLASCSTNDPKTAIYPDEDNIRSDGEGNTDTGDKRDQDSPGLLVDQEQQDGDDSATTHDDDFTPPVDKDSGVVGDDNDVPIVVDEDSVETPDEDFAASDDDSGVAPDVDEGEKIDSDTILPDVDDPGSDTDVLPYDPAGDDDGDGILNGTEGIGDADGDGTPNYLDTDSDGDTIPDSVETAIDTDGDGTPNYLDTDSDDDGIDDEIELTDDPDGDGTPNYLDTDSDDDSILDEVESELDFDKDGTPNYLDTDSDNDGVPDSTEGRFDTDGDGYADFVDLDSDGDGLADKVEIVCTNIGKDARLFADTDGDGYSDLAEQAVGSDLCDSAEGVKDFVDFYFVLPFEDPEKTDTLVFKPKIHKADIFFSVDTTYSMNDEINNLKSGLSTIMSQTRSRVADSAFGVAKWEDFNGGGFGSGNDMPWTLLQVPTTSTSTAQNGVNQLTLGNGEDVPESGYESLYQLATGNGVSWTKTYDCNCDSWGNCDTCTQNYTVPAHHSGIGGVGFRANSVPIALHITDAPSHNASDYGISSAHTKAQALAGLQSHAIRVITLQTSTDSTANTQLREISSSTNAVVPVCAFKTSASAWRCGANKCCTGSGGAGVNPTGSNCVLKYDLPANATGMGTAIVDGIDAVIKYSTLNIYANPQDDGSSSTIDTACFLKRIEALRFVAPPHEPEHSCTPTATPATYNGASYHNGFSGFAPGTSSESKEGSHLEFTVHAQNDTCFEPTDSEAKVFTAHIQIVDQATGAILDTQDVTIIVPGKIPTGGSEG